MSERWCDEFFQKPIRILDLVTGIRKVSSLDDQILLVGVPAPSVCGWDIQLFFEPAIEHATLEAPL
jgi:hypothetical protein